MRAARRVTLTDAGVELLADARKTLAAAERLTRRARFVGRGGLSSVSVGFVWSTLGGYLAPLVAGATERHRHVDLSVSQLRVAELGTALRRGEVDLLIARRCLRETELLVTRLNRERTVVAIPAGHPLARRATIEPGDLDGEPIVSLACDAIPTAVDAARAWLANQGVVPSRHQAVDSPSEALALVAAGVGIYYRLPASAALPRAGVVHRELTGMGTSTLLVRRPEPPSAALAAIVELARDLFGDASDASSDAAEGPEASPLA